VPHSYAISGISFILPLSKTRKLPKHINAAEAMKYVISGGVTTVEEEEVDAKASTDAGVKLFSDAGVKLSSDTKTN
jgi:uncharacterized membrane protein